MGEVVGDRPKSLLGYLKGIHRVCAYSMWL